MKTTLRTWLLGVVLAGFALAASAQEMHARVSGTWQQIDEIHARVSGTWREVQEGWVRVSGTWEQFYVNETLSEALDGSTQNYSDLSAGTAQSGLFVDSDGSIYEDDGGAAVGGTPWLVNGVTSEYEVQVTADGAVSGDSTGTYLALSSTRHWYVQRASNGSTTRELTVTIREIADTANSITFTVNLDAEVF